MLSIIIPALDEAKTIGKTISHLQRLNGDFEVVVVDGGSRDATRKIVEKTGVKLVKAERGIPEQLEAGVLAAKGDRFLFLHADCQVPEHALEHIASLEGRAAGAFAHQYDKFHVLSSLQAGINNLNARFFGRLCGEQAFYCTKEALMAAGGVPDSFVFETEELSAQMREAGVDLQFLPGPVVSSNRRFANNGLAAFLGLNWAHAVAPIASPYKLKKYFGKVR